MGWILAAAQPDPSFPAGWFALGLITILLAYAGEKTGKLTGPPRQRGEWLKTGYQGDEPRPGGISRQSDPFTFTYVILCMYLFGTLMILTAIVESLLT